MINLHFILFTTVVILFREGAEAYNIGELCDNDGDSREMPLCTRYLKCENGYFVLKKCTSGKVFDHVKKECVTLLSSRSNCYETCSFHDKKAVKGSQTMYAYCKKGELEIEVCSGYFNRLTKMCLPNVFSQEKRFHKDLYPKCQPGSRKPISNLCSKFMECNSKSTWVLNECSGSHHFEPKTMQCVWKWKYYCNEFLSNGFPSSVSTEEPSSTMISRSTDIPSTVSLPTDEPSSSSSAITCEPTSEITPTDSPATATENFPTEESSSSPEITSTQGLTTEIVPTVAPSSEYPTEVPTEKPTSETPPGSSTTPAATTTSPTTTTPTTTPTTTTTQATTTTTRPTTSTTKPPIPECKTQGQKKIFKKGDCKDYLECDSGKWVKKTCSWGWDFDINKLECVFSWWAKC